MLRTNPLNQPLKQVSSKEFKKMILAATCWLNEHKDYVDALNVYPVPDGDTGTNMYLTVLNAAKEVEGTESEFVGEIADALQTGALMGARGNSGVILSQLFRGMARSLKGQKYLTADNLASALQGASELAYKAVMKPVEGTILTVARFVGKGAEEEAAKTDDLLAVLEAAVKEGSAALQQTPEMLPVLKDAGVVDAGGQGYLFLMEGMLRVLKGQSVEETITMYDGNKSAEEKKPVALGIPAEDIEFAYCTEFIILSNDVPIDQVRSHLEKAGDSLLVVGAKGITKVHVHTNNPGLVLDYALTFGQLTKIKIENMVEQSQQREAAKPEPKKPFGVVTVTAGEGLAEIFESLGVDQVVRGGQSMNPSTQDLVEAVERINSDHIFILPNNKNIIFAAEQVQNLTDKEVMVVATRSIPQGISCLMRINPEVDFAANGEVMRDGLSEVKTGEITYAVRNSRVNSIEITEGDCLGLFDGEIQIVGKDGTSTSIDLLTKMVDEDNFLITIYYGSDVTEEQAEALREEIEEQFEDLDVELYYGGQPLYDYVFSVE